MRICCVLASDADFFYQAQACIVTLEHAAAGITDHEIRIGFVAIDLVTEQTAWLRDRGVVIFDDIDALPRFAQGPRHAPALTCRPVLPRILPGYDGYMWIDSDIRFLDPHGLRAWVDALAGSDAAIVISQEVESAYTVNHNPALSYNYHSERLGRLAEVYDPAIVERLRYFMQFNSGLFAADALSPIWPHFERALQRALSAPFDRMREQDALNVAILEVGRTARMPSVLNWLCSLAVPLRAADGTWRHPLEPARLVHVAHLTNSSDFVDTPIGRVPLYEYYCHIGLTA